MCGSKPAAEGGAENLGIVGNIDQGPGDVDIGSIRKCSCALGVVYDYCFGFVRFECETIVAEPNMEGTETELDLVN